MQQRRQEMAQGEQKDGPLSTDRDRVERSGYDDEISLVDLWLILARRRWWLIGIAVAVLVVGTLYALAQPTKYRFQTTIELPKDDNQTPLVTTGELRELIQELFIPIAEAELSADEPEYPVAEVQVIGVDALRVVLLRSTAMTERQGPVENMHQRVLAMVQAEFTEDVARIRQDLGDRLSQIQIEHANALRESASRQAELAESITATKTEHVEILREFDALQMALAESIVVAETQHTDTLRDLDAKQAAREREARDHQTELETLKRQDELVERQLAAITPLREEFAAEGATAAPGLMTFIQEPRTTLLNMQQRLEREQAVEITRALTQHRTHLQRLTRELADGKAQREAIVQRQEIEITRMNRDLQERATEREAIVSLQAIEIERMDRQLKDAEAEHEATAQLQSIERASLERLQNRISDTTARGAVAARAPRPEGQGRAMIMALSLVLGGMLGIFGAFFREFLDNVDAATE